MTDTNEADDFTSIGCLAGQLQHGVRSIEQAATILGLSPAMRLNGVPHFDARQVELLAAHLARSPVIRTNPRSRRTFG